MKRFLLIATLFALLTACGGQAQTPAPTVDVQATISSLSGTMAAGTLTAQPTATLTPTSTPEPPTETPVPPTETATPSPEPTGTPTLPVFYGEFAPAGLPSGVNKGYILFENETKIKPIHLNINGTTAQGERPYYYKWTFEERQHRLNIPFGTYDYVVFLGDKKLFVGTFRINNFDKTTFFIRDDKVVIVGP
jgi:hypothetical protein